MSAARILEIFSSLQGEGIYAGRPHLFVRFFDCNLACAYCDTDTQGSYRELTPAELSDEVRRSITREGPHHAVSLTGGEPLLWWRFLKEWLPSLKALGQRAYLETNGVLAGNLEPLLPWIDIIAMDIKPPSATAERPLWREHEDFLKVAASSAAELFVKVVVTGQTRDDDLQRAVDLIAGVRATLPLVLQPVTPSGPVRDEPTADQLARWRAGAAERLADVRVLPQMHRLWGVP